MKNTALLYVLEKKKLQNTLGGSNPAEKAKISEWLSAINTEKSKKILTDINASLVNSSYLASPVNLTVADLMVYYNTHSVFVLLILIY